MEGLPRLFPRPSGWGTASGRSLLMCHKPNSIRAINLSCHSAVGEWAWAPFLPSFLLLPRLPPSKYLASELLEMSRAWRQPDSQLARMGGAGGQAPAPWAVTGVGLSCPALLTGDPWAGARGAGARSPPRPESAAETPPVPGNTDTRTWAGREAEQSPGSENVRSPEFISSGDSGQANRNEDRFPTLKIPQFTSILLYSHPLFTLFPLLKLFTSLLLSHLCTSYW